ncbi:mannitol-1-phosphate 5-dehydrogenase [Vagococcus xieshaowenii]|uniref:Mannitol-1-phosphate 5-dehydrogenase n=1 Tax=Vagococcus xieshaowenii TaxID=2562451 RepID=A0AAJ5EG77_9ENTE|nr:mannitol-1-phosphate 5-dehydrogenase [Vagococcus xieshaowenii]QCA28352.1 mannitol-1-phosphate 5-dehydrogenase [Vagococcus xieshaowenii]TFZ42260.1 mannitol-1-phosphate 5-dehydrogenase [Vagococcus xieshaowenii]
MKKAVHFGAGNIGRGFIGEVLSKNNYQITFVDINETIIDALATRGNYQIELASDDKAIIEVNHVTGLNNGKEPEAVVEAVAEADIVTTAIGPNILPYIAELIAKGLIARKAQSINDPIDIIACENMIGGSKFLQSEVEKYLDSEMKDYLSTYVGFPNAAVDRIVPNQSHEDALFVSVEPFREWVIDESMSKNAQDKLEGVIYVEDLEPYIERKLFSVNTGHATVAYTGAFLGYKTIDEAMKDDRVLKQIQQVLTETGSLLIDKWQFDQEAHHQYTQKIIHRFENANISDDITRVARTPIRKLGYDERFIRPIRELASRGLNFDYLAKTVQMILDYKDPKDEESVKLQEMRQSANDTDVLSAVTGIKDKALIEKILS